GRHTRFSRDWSSDVCSSDLGTPGDPGVPTVIEVPADPALSFAKTGVLSADGNTIEYTFTVTNIGIVTMDGVTVNDPKITDPIAQIGRASRRERGEISAVAGP